MLSKSLRQSRCTSGLALFSCPGVVANAAGFFVYSCYQLTYGIFAYFIIGFVFSNSFHHQASFGGFVGTDLSGNLFDGFLVRDWIFNGMPSVIPDMTVFSVLFSVF
jgi:hypothetical protein